MTTLTNPGYQTAPVSGDPVKDPKDAAHKVWARRLAEIINEIRRGKVNASLPVTLTASSATTTVKDARISGYSTIILQPLTAHAFAAYVTSPYITITNQQTGQLTLNHVNDANADKNFNMLIIG